MSAITNENSAASAMKNKKPAVSFTKGSEVRFFNSDSVHIGTPVQQGMETDAKITANKLRNSTPHVSKLKLENADLENSFQAAEPASTKKPSWNAIEASVLKTTRALEHEKKLRTPLTIFSAAKPLHYVPSDTIPASVRKFMASRAKKPAVKAVRSLSQEMQSQHFPSPLKTEIQQEGARLNARRQHLLERLEDFGLNSSRYALWPVSELEQRVAGLEEEERRAGAEALLIEAGHDPKDFTQFSSDEIEAFLEKELTRQARTPSDLRMTPFQGSRISFASEASFVSHTEEEESGAKVESNETEIASAEETAPTEKTAVQAEPTPVDEVVQQMSEMVIVAPKTVKVAIPKPDPMTMTCEQIRAELKVRGLKVSGLKSVIAERLAQAYADEIEEEEMLTEGHEFIGKTVVRHFESGVSNGVVKAFLPPVEGQPMNTARFHIVHEDGDAEVVDYEEAKEAVEEAMKEGK